MQNKTTITCPNYKTQIDVNKIQYHELEERLRRDHNLAVNKLTIQPLTNEML